MIEEICKQLNITPEDLLIRELQQRIDKAIEYIINKKYWDGINNYRLSNADELLEILKGSDK